MSASLIERQGSLASGRASPIASRESQATGGGGGGGLPASDSFDQLLAEGDASGWVEYAPCGANAADAPKLLWNPVTKEFRMGRAPGEERRRAPQQPNHSQFVVDAVEHVRREMGRVLERAQHLSATICDQARHILAAADSIQKELQQGGEKAVDERNDVQFLVDFTKLKWRFHKNPHVDQYRLSTQNFDHRSFRFTDWHTPKYLAQSLPIRTDVDGSGMDNSPPVKGYWVRVVLPIRGMDGTLGDAPLLIQATDSAKRVISAAHDQAKVKQSFAVEDVDLGVSDDYVLKACGASDYMEGDTPLLHFEYVRQALRTNKPIVLYLERRPEPTDVEHEEIYAESYQQQLLRSEQAWQSRQQQLAEDLKLGGAQARHLAQALPVTPDRHTFQDLDSMPPVWSDLRFIPAHELHVPFRFEFSGLEGVIPGALPFLRPGSASSPPRIFLQVFVFYGTQRLRSTCWSSTPLPLDREMVWRQQMCGPARETLISQLPREARLGMILCSQASPAEDAVRLGWAVRPLHDEYGLFLQGPQTISLWPFEPRFDKHGKEMDSAYDPEFIYRATTRDNQMPSPSCKVHLRFPTFEAPVVAPLTPRYRRPDVLVVGRPYPLSSLTDEEAKQLNTLIGSDPLYKLTPGDRRLLWRMRHHLVRHPQVLPKFLQCVDWGSQEHKLEAHRLLRDWSPPENIATALELLDVKYQDYAVREYAVDCLRRLDDHQLQPFLLQLTQCLKFESYHNNPLTRFLLSRALANPLVVGHFLFWHLKSELHEPRFAERFALVLEEYLSYSGRHAVELRKQCMMTIKFTEVSGRVVQMRNNRFSSEDVKAQYHQDLQRLNRDFFVPMKKFQVPFNPKLEATKLIVEKCRYMSSKMVPLWLVFENADPQGEPIVFIFKSGDDLRQDILTLQLLTIMDRMWLSAGLDLRMKPYKVLSTGINAAGDGVGFIEVVLNADTTSNVQFEFGGGATGAFKLEPLANYLQKHNGESGPKYEVAVESFLRSCAGYLLATFVLGIGDRHNDNIMLSKDGHLFHIDFGHFLGNFKKKFGVNRERAAFVFTLEMAYVIGGRNYKDHPRFVRFLDLCFKGYQVLRQNALVLENLFVLMIAAGMPELLAESDINYMRNMLMLDQPKKKAEDHLYAEIKRSLGTTYRRVDNFIHNMRHR